MKQKILITSALPYANGPLHFGHIAGAYLPADCYARFCRLQGKDVLYICGSDEYGVAITLSAELTGRTPQEQVDFFHALNIDLFKKLNFSFDHYSRTTWQGHVETVQQFFTDLLANGYIEESVTEQLFSEQENRFLADRYVVGTCPKCGFDKARGDECQKCGASYEATDLRQPYSKMTGSPLVKRSTKHWFLRFDLFKEKLAEFLGDKKWKPNVLRFAKSYAENLKPRAITRDATWGVPVPLLHAEGKVLYVWFDAPIGYISATKEWAEKMGDKEAWKKYWLDARTKYVQFIGKDNIPFHAVFFPAMEMGQNVAYKRVDELPANEFLNLEGRQFSKSEGWTIDLDHFFTKFTEDQIRYVIAANAPETQDAEFTWKDFQTRCNAELLGKMGNFAHRVLVFLHNKCQGVIPQEGQLGVQEKEFLDNIEAVCAQAADAYEKFQLRKASSLLMELAQMSNTYFDTKKPWALAKEPAYKEELEGVLRCCLKALQAIVVVSYPLIPKTAQKLWEMLGHKTVILDHTWEELLKKKLSEGLKLPEPKILFQRVEDEAILPEIEKLKSLAQVYHL